MRKQNEERISKRQSSSVVPKDMRKYHATVEDVEEGFESDEYESDGYDTDEKHNTPTADIFDTSDQYGYDEQYGSDGFTTKEDYIVEELEYLGYVPNSRRYVDHGHNEYPPEAYKSDEYGYKIPKYKI